jgi:hypothetical protein
MITFMNVCVIIVDKLMLLREFKPCGIMYD